MNLVILFTCVAFLAFADEIFGENIQEYICQQTFTGYTLDYSRRKCVKGRTKACTFPFPYKTMRECTNDFKGKGNICKLSPCLHGGLCLPVTKRKKRRTFKCDCFTTGYYGKHCHKRCPKKLNRRSKQTACIRIGG